ncbi:MAG: glycosyltransferase [Candidatus Gracilibacteria bacterium]|nr:glycosyltransferase [Candidatus Gracilibacteria bacterium]
MNPKNKRIAIIADWLIDFGGAELVISHLLELFPNADIYTSVCFMDHPMLQGRNVYTSWLQKIPFLNRKHKLAGILRPWAFRSFDLSGYDVVICSSSAESKQVAMGKWKNKDNLSFSEGESLPRKKGILATQGGQKDNQRPKVIVYCHTPTRYYWSHAKEYEDMMEFGWMNPFVKFVFRLVKNWMQKVDFAAAQRVDYFIANSKTTAERIKTYYNRESEVIYPGAPHPSPLLQERGFQVPLPLSEGEGTEGGGGYYFGMSRCIPYKKLDLLVDAFNANGKQLILATNTDNLLYRELCEKSKDNITWVFNPPKEEKLKLYTETKAFLFPPEEDFGLVPVEAMMSGTPVIAYGRGGGTESVIDGETGIFFSPQTPEALNEAIERFETLEWDTEKIQARGMEFSKENFQKKILTFIENHAQ